MPQLSVVLGDITTMEVDALVNAANHRMRGGGGVDGAIHRAGGIELTQDCINRYPDGLNTGEAGWTTAGNMPAKWVIHAIGPNYNFGERDPDLLESCYRNALEVADELGARTVAFPLISSGIYGWPLDDAASRAVATVASQVTSVLEVTFVAFSEEIKTLLELEVSKHS